MVISKANHIRFKQWIVTNSAIRNWDTALGFEQIIRGRHTQKVNHIWQKDENITFQVMVATGNDLSYVLSGYSTGFTYVSKSLLFTVGSWDFYTITFSADTVSIDNLIILRELDGLTLEDTYITEPIDIVDKTDYELGQLGYLKLTWTSDDNMYLYDYSNDDTHTMWVQGRVFEYQPKSEANIFSNDEETILLSETIQRQLKVEITEINPQIAEIITVAMSHPYFYVNGMQLVKEEAPEINHFSNFVELSAVMTQANVTGLTTDGTDSTTENNVYMLIDPIPLAYVPASTGNPVADRNKFVIASDGTNWVIDNDGRGKKFNEFPELFEDFTGLTTNYVTVTVGTLTASSQDKYINVYLNGVKLNYSGASATAQDKYGINYGSNQILFFTNLVATDLVEVYFNT